jgi:hypothetical protein
MCTDRKSAMDRNEIELLVEEWAHLLGGPVPKIDVILRRILDAVLESGSVRCSFATSDIIHLTFGDRQEATCRVDNAGHKVRLLCASMARLFNQAGGEPVNLYRGSCVKRIVPYDISFALEFENTQGDQWFRIAKGP